MDTFKYIAIFFSCLCAPIFWLLALFAFFEPIRAARTQTQRTTYLLMTVFAPLVFPVIGILLILSLFISPALITIFLALLPIGGIIVFFLYIFVPSFQVVLQQSTEKYANQLFYFIMNSYKVPIQRIDHAIDTLAASAWKILVRNPSSRVIHRRETDTLMNWFGRSRGRVTYLLALLRDPRLPKDQRLEALTTLGSIAVDERNRNISPGRAGGHAKTRASDLLRELACDPGARVYLRLEAARTLARQQFPAEALAGFWALSRDTNITDQRTRVSIAQGLIELGPAARAQAFTILTQVVADHSANREIRYEAGKAAVPLCDNVTDAGTVDAILKRWMKSQPSPSIWLKVARILIDLSQCHKNNAHNLIGTFNWDVHATRLLRWVVLHPTAMTNTLYSFQALRLMGATGEIPTLIELGSNPHLDYSNRDEAARILDSLNKPAQAARIWMALAQETKPTKVKPAERVKAAFAAGQRGLRQESKGVLQSVAQDTCEGEPRTCLEAAVALRQLGWYEEAIAFVMVLDKHHREHPDLKAEIADAMRWREL